VEWRATFNGWRPEYTPLQHGHGGRMDGAPDASFRPIRYRFVVDGHWVDDPEAAPQVANPFGGFNSVVKGRFSM